MTKVVDQNIPPENYDAFVKACRIVNHFSGLKIDKKEITYRKRNFASLKDISNAGGCGSLWWALTEQQRADWYDAAYWTNMSGWDLFFLDTSYRLANGINGVATPSLMHQYLVGKINIESPASSITIYKRYTGIPSVEVSFASNVKVDLVSVGAGSYARMTVRVKTGYWLDDIEDWEIIDYVWDLTEFTDWDYVSDFYDGGFVGENYVEFIIDVYNMRGIVYVDGFELWVNSENIFIDYQCDNFQSNFIGYSVPAGSSFLSVYPPDD